MSTRLLIKNIVLIVSVGFLMNAFCDTDNSGNEALEETRPVITSLDREGAMVGQDVVITGTKFGDDQALSTVRLNGIDFDVVSWSDTEITVTVVDGMTSGIVVVTVDGLPSQSGPEAQLFITEG